MEYGSRASAVTEASSSLSPTAIDEETLWQMTLRANETMENGQYPERPGEPDCAYYMRTGLCRFGMTCRFNHPPNRKLAVASARMEGGYPERVGQPECQYRRKIPRIVRCGICVGLVTCLYKKKQQAKSKENSHYSVHHQYYQVKSYDWCLN